MGVGTLQSLCDEAPPKGPTLTPLYTISTEKVPLLGGASQNRYLTPERYVMYPRLFYKEIPPGLFVSSLHNGIDTFFSYSIKTEETNLLVGQAAPRDYLSAYFAGLKKVVLQMMIHFPLTVAIVWCRGEYVMCWVSPFSRKKNEIV